MLEACANGSASRLLAVPGSRRRHNSAMDHPLPDWLYPALLQIHHATVACSIVLFAARGSGVLAHQTWPMQRGWRRLSVGIDSTLLCAGASMWALAGYNPLVQTWLGVKLLLLLVYIGLGTVALKRGRSQGVRAVSFGLAMGVALTMVTIALKRAPWGWLAN